MDAATLYGAVGAAGGATAVLVAVAQLVGRPVRRLSRQNDEFRADWYGQPARSGVAARPGVMERLGKIEQNTEALPDRVTRIEQRLDDHERAHMMGGSHVQGS